MIDYKSQQEKLDELSGIAWMISLEQRKLESQRATLKLPSGSMVWSFDTPKQVEYRCKFYESVIARLERYYAKKLFALASHTYNIVNPKLKAA